MSIMDNKFDGSTKDICTHYAKSIEFLGLWRELQAQAGARSFEGKKRSELSREDFLFRQDCSFPIVTPKDIEDSIVYFEGQRDILWFVVHRRGMKWQEFKKKLSQKAKAKGPEFVAGVSEEARKKLEL
jgi:hypothetical protein